MRAVCVALAVGVLNIAQARLLFPPGSDLGYILPDNPEPENYENNANWVNDVEEYNKALPLRGEREALGSVGEAFWRSLQDRISEEERSVQNQELQHKVGAAESLSDENFLHHPRALALKNSVPADLPDNLKDDKHGVAMGIPHVKCDNAKVNLTIDWDGSFINYTCIDYKRNLIPVQENLKSVQQCVDLPKKYTPQHICMNQIITYNTTLPTFGPHRPLWPVFGEYKFVPVQRWLHSLEHGAIVMLYDPCTQEELVEELRKLLTGCYRKHIITPYTLLTRDRPLALLAWGCSLEMATVNKEEVKTFIKTRALHGPEGHFPKDGSYKELLKYPAKFPTGATKDSEICPELPVSE